MVFFATLVQPELRHIVAKDKNGVVLGECDIPNPSSLDDAVALFGSAQAVVEAAMATLDIKIQAKKRQQASTGRASKAPSRFRS